MRVRTRDQRGIVGVWLAILLVLLLGMIAMSLDVGLVVVRTRQVQNANDAAALAAALSCIQDAAPNPAAQAAAAFSANVNAAPAQPWSFKPTGGLELSGCVKTGGTVTTYFGSTQQLYFAAAIINKSQATINRKATATWGAAGTGTGVAPLMLSMNKLSDCNIPNGVTTNPPTTCTFWWKNDQGNQDSDWDAVGNGEWGYMDLERWGVDKTDTSACNGSNVTKDEFGSWLAGGIGTLSLDEVPTYVCAGTGLKRSNVVQITEKTTYVFPVNDPNQQVTASGSLCNTSACTKPDKFAIVGFAWLYVEKVLLNKQAFDACGQLGKWNGQGSAFCLRTKWVDFKTSMATPNPDAENFGVIGVGLTG